MENKRNAILTIILVSLLTSCGDKNSAQMFNLNPEFGLSANTQETESIKLDQYNSIKITKEPGQVNLNHRFLDGTANNILITGTEVILDGSKEPFVSKDTGQLDSVRSLTVEAKKIVIRNRIKLPQAKVVLNAEQLILDEGGVIDITPTNFRAQDEIRPKIGQNGLSGIPGNDIELITSDIIIKGDLSQPRLIANGGTGQNPGAGKDGHDGLSLPTFTTENLNGKSYEIVYAEALHEAKQCDPTILRQADTTNRMMRCYGGKYIPERGSQQWPENGGDAVPAGYPGAGGTGGNIKISVNSINGIPADKSKFTALFQALRGKPGTPSSTYKGGKAGQPQLSAWKMVRDNHSHNPQYFLITKETVDGKDAESPQAPLSLNPDGFVQIENYSPRARSETYYKGRLKLVRDMYIAKKYPAVKSILENDLNELSLLSKNFSDSNNSPVETRARFALLLSRVSLQQDYFGRSVNEAPLYALDFRLNQFDAEIEMALTSYYLTEKILNALESRTLKKEHVAALMAQHQNYIKSESEKQNVRSAKINSLESDLQNLKNHEAAYDRLLADLNRQIEALSRNNVSRRHQIEVLQKNLKVLAALSKVIPVGQPVLAGIGTVMDHLSEIPTDGNVMDYISHAKNAKNNIENAFSGENLKKSRASLDAFVNKMRFSNLDNKSNQEKIQYIEQLQKELGPVYEKINSISQGFKTEIVPADELQAEIQKIKLSDPLFQSASMNLEKMAKQRAEIYKTLQETMQELMSSASVLEESMALSLASQDEYLKLAKFGDSTLKDLVKSIHNMSKDRLLLIYNEVIKAYEYTTLESLPDSPEFELLKEKTVELATTQDNPEEAVRLLKSFYMSFIYKVVISLDNKFNSTSPLMLVRTDSVYLDLSAEQLKYLNSAGMTQIALDKSVFAAHQKNLRIENIEIERSQFELEQTRNENTQKTFIEITHGGEGILEGEGNYARTFTYGSSNKIHTWGSSFQFLGNDILESKMKRDDSVKGILGLLLRDKISALTYSPIFAQPAALTTLNVTKRDHGGSSTLTSLRIKVSYTFY